MKTRTHDLTAGSIPQHMLRLAAPLILGNILQQLYNAVDAFILGRCAGGLEFAAVGIAGSVMNLFLFMITGACTGVSVIFAQLFGANDLETFRREHFLSLVFGLLCTLACSAIGFLCLPLLLRVIQTPQELTGYVTAYLTVILISLPAAFVYNLYGALLRAIGRTARYSFVTGLHQSSLYIGKLLVQGAVNTGGTDMISAYTATTRIEGFANSFGDIGAAATSVLVAQNLGAGKPERVQKTFRSSLVLMLAMGLLSGLVMYLTAGATVGFMLGAYSGPAFESGREYMQLISLFYIFCFAFSAQPCAALLYLYSSISVAFFQWSLCRFLMFLLVYFRQKEQKSVGHHPPDGFLHDSKCRFQRFSFCRMDGASTSLKYSKVSNSRMAEPVR